MVLLLCVNVGTRFDGHCPTCRAADGSINCSTVEDRPQARRLRRSAAWLRGLASVSNREWAWHAAGGSACPHPAAAFRDDRTMTEKSSPSFCKGNRTHQAL